MFWKSTSQGRRRGRFQGPLATCLQQAYVSLQTELLGAWVRMGQAQRKKHFQEPGSQSASWTMALGIRSSASADHWSEPGRRPGQKHLLSSPGPTSSPTALPAEGQEPCPLLEVQSRESCALESTVHEPAVENECDKVPSFYFLKY